MSTGKNRKRRPTVHGRRGHRRLDTENAWRRANVTIRFYGIAFLLGTKLADVVTTVVGVRYVPTITEANPVADWVFIEWGLFTGLTVLGFGSVLLAVCAAELFGRELKRRFGLPKTALFAQASIYLMLSALFAVVSVLNGLLIADQLAHVLGDTLAIPDG